MISADTLRVATLNLFHHPETLPARLPAAAAALVACDADVVCVQEAGTVGEASTLAGLADLMGYEVAAASALPTSADGHGVGVLTRLSVLGSDVLVLPGDGGQRAVAAATVAAGSGRSWTFLSTHLTWLGSNEPVRLAQAAAIEAWLAGRGPEPVTVLAGDFNTNPDSDTLRYLTGRSGLTSPGAYWVDAWEHCGTGPGYTFNPSNPWAVRQAEAVGIDRPAMLPSRRIDYVLVRGWAYGRPGCPLSVDLVGEYAPGGFDILPSDHYGVVATLWDPPVD